MTITMPRGDLRPVRFTVCGEDGGETDLQFDEIYFTVKASYNDARYKFQKRLSRGDIERLEDGSYQFAIRPEDTDGLMMSKYVFDIELVLGEEIKQTTVGELILTSEVTHAADEV